MKYILLERALFHNSAKPGWRYWETWRGLSKAAKAVLPIIILHANNFTGRAFPSQTRIGELAGLSQVSVSKAVRELNIKLNSFHILTRRQGKKSHNLYEYQYDQYRAVFVPSYILYRYSDLSLPAKALIPALMFRSEPVGDHDTKTEHKITLTKTAAAKIAGIDRHIVSKALSELKKWGFLRQEKNTLYAQLSTRHLVPLAKPTIATKLPDNFF